MPRYGFPDLKVEFDNAAAALVDMSAYVWTINGMSKEAILQEVTAAGDDDAAWAKVGLNKVDPITITGPYDDTASTGPDVIFNAIGNAVTRTLKLTYGSTKTTSVECIIRKYERKPSRGELHTYSVELQPTGAVTET